MAAILTVSELTRSVKNLLEAEFPFVWVRGQVTNLARPASGHVYFTLTDGDAALNVVWFKSAQESVRAVPVGGERINPLTGEVEESSGESAMRASGLEDGLDVLCAGRLNVYEPRGQYQMIAELVQDQGVGDLHLQFEALKRKLAAKGYFDEERKMELPRNPARVAVITSPRGAAIRDFLRIAETRGTGSEIRIYPSLVQGDLAPEQIAAALDAAGDDDWAEVAVLIRGGGSLEDLWAFNTEAVADAIFRARIPVLCGVGHEPDVSIADFVADRRAATPSHAAQELWPRRETLAQGVDVLDMRLGRAYAALLRGKRAEFASLRKALVWLSPQRRVERLEERYSSLLGRLGGAGWSHFFSSASRAAVWTGRLQRAFGPESVAGREIELENLSRRLMRAAHDHVEAKTRVLELTGASLTGLDPEKPLERGYSLVRVERTSGFLRSPDQVLPGDRLDIRVRDGRVAAVVADDNSETDR
ncbi:exodeoxyribonuclease VII large subunit [Pseudodesulfovibrio tunisiensis]|uniref:exodeoxyribonuclease VII large subunit n=1 Tax=Pseudodesulfovibrio tunisiensis TaxID=463192 RepID=UPI001FB4C61D|nr:exodeoxyribonuclease VII large subunit [Pseudodesulfovibrio tunisiensis]